jgi:hypothetical protein
LAILKGKEGGSLEGAPFSSSLSFLAREDDHMTVKWQYDWKLRLLSSPRIFLNSERIV